MTPPSLTNSLLIWRSPAFGRGQNYLLTHYIGANPGWCTPVVKVKKIRKLANEPV